MQIAVTGYSQSVSTANGETLDDLHFVLIEFLSPHRRGPPCQIAHLLQLSPPPLQMGKLEKYTRVICPAIVNLFSFPCSNCPPGMTWAIFFHDTILDTCVHFRKQTHP